MSPALETNGGRSKSTIVFMHFCIECNGKSVKFDTIGKIKVTSVLEIFVSLRYVMYIHMICEKKEIKTGGHRSYKKMGAVPKVRIGDKTLFLSRSRTLKTFFARYDSVTNSGNASLYGLQKYDLKYGLSVHIKYEGRFKSQLYMQNTFLSKSQTLKYLFC